jgi:phosphatidylglycerol---prolipoprotein diacylglyceryl transferase
MIVHRPAILQLGPLALTGFGVAVLAAFAIAQTIMQREMTRRGQDAAIVPDIVFAAVVGTLVGAKLYYVAFITHNWTDVFTRSGYVFFGGFIGAVFACWLVIRRRRVPFLRIADVAGIAIAAGYSVGRTGCWAIGDDYGRPWASPWAVQFPHGAPPSTVANMVELFGVRLPANLPLNAVVSVYPTQLYEVVLGFVMFLLLWRLRAHQHEEGWLFGLYLVLAGVERFGIEFLRAKDDHFFIGGITSAQAVALALTIIGALVMAARRATNAPRRPDLGASRLPRPA